MISLKFRRIKPDEMQHLRAWMGELMQRQEEVRETFRQEGVRHETAYLLQTPEGPALVYAVEMEDEARAQQVYAASQLPLDLEHRQHMRAVQTGPLAVELLYDVRLEPGSAPSQVTAHRGAIGVLSDDALRKGRP
jgi:hypothetical protein